MSAEDNKKQEDEQNQNGNNSSNNETDEDFENYCNDREAETDDARRIMIKENLSKAKFTGFGGGGGSRAKRR